MTPVPLASIPSSAGSGQTDELVGFKPPYTIVAYSVPSVPPKGLGALVGRFRMMCIMIC